MIPIPPVVQLHVIRILKEVTGSEVRLLGFSFAGGGCINHGGKISTNSGDFFVKWNEAQRYPGMFEAEALGLELLRKHSRLHVPIVTGWFEENDFQGILMEFVEEKPKNSSYWQRLGVGLAELHKNSSGSFGLDHNNYIGSLPQDNLPSPDWIDFFIEQRLMKQLRLAVETRHFGADIVKEIEQLCLRLPELLPPEEPSLLHGDLWSGNVITNQNGDPCLIDPAVYFGHREAEVAFTKLFGGFNESFYRSYNEVFPLEKNFDERINIYNLYPLLVHVNLFGGGYASQVRSILKEFS